MFSTKPKPPRPDRKAELDIKLGELKWRYDIMLTHWRNAPVAPDMLSANNAITRRYTFDQRDHLSRAEALLAIVQTCTQDAMKVWPEGKRVFSLLMAASDLMLRVVENALEENYLWDRSDPLDNYSQNRRAKIFPENRKLAAESDEKFLAGCRLLSELTGWSLYTPDRE